MGGTNNAAILAEGLTKTYGGRGGVRDLDLSVPSGAIYGFLGPNGAGKSTTIRLLLGFMKAMEGQARVLGKDSWSEGPAIRADVGYIPGDLRLYPWMNLDNALKIVGNIRKRDLSKRGRELAEVFELAADVPCRKMSRGMRQKLGLIIALAHDPKVLILDEPTTALDPPMQKALYGVLRERARAGATVFFSSHTLGEVEELCARVAILRDGVLIADESVEALRARAHRVVHLMWRGEPPEASALLDGLTIESREGRRWTCLFDGPAKPLVDWAAGQPLEDLDISPPDLDRVFHAFYRDEEHAR